MSSRKRARMCPVIESIRPFKEPFRKKQGGNITQELVAFFSSLCLRSREYFCIVLYFPIITRTSKASPFFCALTKRNFTLSLLGLSRLCSIGTFWAIVLPFWAIFEQNIGLENISSPKKLTFDRKLQFMRIFLNIYQPVWTPNFLFHNVSPAKKGI